MEAESEALASENRREWVRIEDRVLLEYWPVADESASNGFDLRNTSDQAIVDFLSKPTADLLARIPAHETEPVLMPWMLKIDYVLALVLKTLARLNPQGVPLPRLTLVNISAGGVSFPAATTIQPGVMLGMRLILPPFVPVQATAEVIRSSAHDKESGYIVATKFVEMSQEDQERLIKHILSVQAKQLRARPDPT